LRSVDGSFALQQGTEVFPVSLHDGIRDVAGSSMKTVGREQHYREKTKCSSDKHERLLEY
jgi:hypothetical protein